MLYAAKCYWPGLTQADLESVAERAAQTGPGRDRVAYLGSLLFAADDLVLCLFQGPSRAAVIEASDRLGIPFERLMEPEWLPQTSPSPKEHRNDQCLVAAAPVLRAAHLGALPRAYGRCSCSARGTTHGPLARSLSRSCCWPLPDPTAPATTTSDLMLFVTGVAVLPAWLIWTGRISGTSNAPPEPR
jgi:hypothetical protein